MEGIVKWFDVKKGYGFINAPEVTDDGGNLRDIFVHYTKIQMEGFRKLEAAEPVTFELVWAEDGRPQAETVVRVNPPGPQE
jgi:CspA family cold shock protein